MNPFSFNEELEGVDFEEEEHEDYFEYYPTEEDWE
jgi:hypothetical protein